MKGLTIVEIIISIAIIIVLGTITAFVFPRFRSSLVLHSALEDGLSLLEEAKSKTLSSENESQYGVNFASSTMTLFAGTTYNPLDPSNRRISFSSDVEISCISLVGGASSTVFERLTGETDQYGVIKFHLTSDPNAVQSLILLPSGESFIYKEPKNLIGYWSFDEGAGTIAKDNSGIGNDGTLINMNVSSAWVNGKMCGGLLFDGADDYVLIPAGGDLDVAGDFTISLWVKPSVSSSSFHSSWNYFVWQKDPNLSETMKYELGYYNDDGPRFKPYNQSGVHFDFSPDMLFPADVWRHIVYRREGPLLEIYVDGSLADSRADFSGDLRLTGDGGELRIGGQGGSSGFIGAIDEVRIYDKALDINEIKNLYMVGI